MSRTVFDSAKRLSLLFAALAFFVALGFLAKCERFPW